MSKMKHLLKKLHIGGGLNDQPPLRLAETRPRPVVPTTTNPSPNSNPSPSSSSDLISAAMGRFGAVESGPDRAAGVGVGGGDGGGCVDFNFLEEEFQVQLALAISASDPDAREDPESAQIDAAKRMSLGCSGSSSTADSEALLSLQYWSYNVVNYDEKLMDGFYDVYGVTSSSVTQGKMPLLVDLQAVSILDNVNYDVILVNRSIDPHLQQLEGEACTISMECRYSERGISGLIQKVADMVVNRMGGPVGDADGMLKRWSIRRSKLRNSLNSIVLPLGCLDVGLSRHRALLFKVLADRINLPCMLVKGSYYTGTDDGAVDLIKMGNGSEYIIDLMGAPGALIPAEVPSTRLLNSGLEIRSFSDSVETLEASCLVPEKGTGPSVVSSLHDKDSEGGNMLAGTALSVDIQRKDDQRKLVKETSTKKFENEFGRLLPSLHNSGEGSSGTCGKASPAEKMQVKNVSKYVLSASKHPEFAQKLHAVLLESGAPQHLLESGAPQQYDGEYLPFPLMQPANLIDFDGEQKQSDEHSSEKHKELGMNAVHSNFYLPSVTSEEVIAVRGSDGMNGADAACLGDSCQRPLLNDLDAGKKCAAKLKDTTSIGVLIECNGHSKKINFGEDAEWEISWEDLQIGERIGIGSYGEVYHADWNGTEVAVKKFLDQDFSGDSLVQFKSEVEIMLRLRHPNVVLFMGAVTRSPHFSILTEFLPRGSLYRLIHRPNQLDERRRMRMALDVAKGMNYLHTSHPTIVHRDLKSPNLLVDKNWVVKVCDFGLSRTKNHTFLSSKSTAGTPEWMAPEVLRNEPANEKCDVYSFGVILWELATLQIPWRGLNPMQVVGAVGFQHRRLEIPEHIDPTVAQIIRDCWLTEPHLRPSFSQLMQRLRRLQHLVVGRTESRNLME